MKHRFLLALVACTLLPLPAVGTTPPGAKANIGNGPGAPAVAAPMATLDRHGAWVTVEAYGPNVVHVTIAADKAQALKGPGYGIIAGHADDSAFHATSDQRGDTFTSRALTLHVDAPPPPRAPAITDRYFAPQLAPVSLQVKNASGTTVVDMTGNAAQFYELDLTELTVHVTANEPVVDQWCDESVTVYGAELTTDPSWQGDWTERWGRAATQALMASHPETDAIIAASDSLARSALDILRDLGRPVPREVAVMGFDNWAPIAQNSRPELTSIDLELQTLGRLAAHRLFQALGGTPPAPGIEYVPVRLVVRESTVTNS